LLTTASRGLRIGVHVGRLLFVAVATVEDFISGALSLGRLASKVAALFFGLVSSTISFGEATSASVRVSSSVVSVDLLLLFVTVLLLLSSLALSFDVVINDSFDVTTDLLLLLVEKLLTFLGELLLLLGQLFDLGIKLLRGDWWAYLNEAKLSNCGKINVESLVSSGVDSLLLLAFLSTLGADHDYAIVFFGLDSLNLAILELLLDVHSVVLINELRFGFLGDLLRSCGHKSKVFLERVAVGHEVITSCNLLGMRVLSILKLSSLSLDALLLLVLCLSEALLLVQVTLDPSCSVILQLKFVELLEVALTHLVLCDIAILDLLTCFVNLDGEFVGFSTDCTLLISLCLALLFDILDLILFIVDDSVNFVKL